ncbi:MAG: C40 family peptidase [Nitrospiria bacterium]
MRTLRKTAWISVFLIALTACGGTPRAIAFPRTTSGQKLPRTQASEKVVQTAHTLLGTPYLFGGTTPKGFDCSGLINYVFRQAARMALPRTTRQLIRVGEPVHRSQLSKGDLVFFRIGHKKSIHIGIYIGEGKFIHSPSTGGKVNIQHLSTRYWKRRYRGARRIL